MPYYFVSEEEKKQHKINQFVALGKQMGKTDEEIKEILRKAEENGSL